MTHATIISAYTLWAIIAFITLFVVRMYFNQKRIKEHQNKD